MIDEVYNIWPGLRQPSARKRPPPQVLSSRLSLSVQARVADRRESDFGHDPQRYSDQSTLQSSSTRLETLLSICTVYGGPTATWLTELQHRWGKQRPDKHAGSDAMD